MDRGYEFCRNVSDKNPVVAGPLKRTDCSLVSDGAAALVLCDVESALSLKTSVVFRAAQQVNDFLPMSKPDSTRSESCAQAWIASLESAGATRDDYSFLQTIDGFTIAERLEHHASGPLKPGQGHNANPAGYAQK